MRKSSPSDETDHELAPRSLVREEKADVMDINVGGKLFTTSTATLRRGGEHLMDLLIGRSGMKDSEGRPFLDVNPHVFERILDFLRRGRLYREGLTQEGLDDLLHEARYMGISSLEEYVKATSSTNSESVPGGSRRASGLHTVEGMMGRRARSVTLSSARDATKPGRVGAGSSGGRFRAATAASAAPSILAYSHNASAVAEEVAPPPSELDELDVDSVASSMLIRDDLQRDQLEDVQSVRSSASMVSISRNLDRLKLADKAQKRGSTKDGLLQGHSQNCMFVQRSSAGDSEAPELWEG